MNEFIKQAAEFTRAYKDAAGEPPAIREAKCLAAQYPAILAPLRPGDVFAGYRTCKELVYAGPIRWFPYPHGTPGGGSPSKQGGYCFDFSAGHRFTNSDSEDAATVRELAEFWRGECSAAQFFAPGSEALELALRPSAVEGNAIGLCMASDFDLLVRRGIPGLREDIATRRATVDDTAFLDGLAMALDVFCNTCQWYAGQARALGDTRMADDLDAIQISAPRTFRQAVQLVWLYNLIACGKHIEWPRMDVALGDLFAAETRSGVLPPEEARRLLLGFWRLINENGEAAVCRITIGGRGRRNPGNADLFALAAMDASRTARLITPQLTLRFHTGQNPALLERAYELIGAGCTYPLLYNDDVVIPGVMKALRVDEKTAEQYFPLGCGEYMIAHISPSLLCLGWNIPQALDMALRNGRDFASFDDLYAAFMTQIENDAVLCAKRYEQICDFHKGRNPFLLASLLAHDCLERNAAIFDGGIRLLGACVMGHGYTNVADSLVAIKRIVFEEKRATLAELATALENDFKGRDDLRRLCLSAPKFGNDDPATDALFAQMWEGIHARVLAATDTTRLNFFCASSVNPGGYYMGHDFGATADGRRAKMPFAIGNAPTAGNDAKGITALCNSVAKTCPASGGATTNFKLSRELFKDNARFAKTVFGVYFANGGQQASITVVDQADLLAAKKQPELYPHIIVRVGGWSSRFIDCEPNVQDDIIQRTFYS